MVSTGKAKWKFCFMTNMLMVRIKDGLSPAIKCWEFKNMLK